LIVDGNKTNIATLTAMLATHSIHACSARSGGKALTMLDRSSYLLMLLSVTVPGFEKVSDRLKEDKALSQITILMLTTTAAAGVQRPARALPYVIKPIIQSELLFAIGHLLNPMMKPASSLQEVARIENHQPANILLAEDNVVNQKLAIRMLEKLGHKVTLVENGLQAVTAVERNAFDLILMDVQMPEMGGFEATGKI